MEIDLKKDPEGSFLQSNFVANEYYFLAAGFTAFLGAAALGATFAFAFAFGAAGAGVTETTFSAARWSRWALISALILSLRSVSLAMLALSFATALAVFETGAFFTNALAAGFTTFAGTVTFFGVAAVFGAIFFAVAIFKFPFYLTG